MNDKSLILPDRNEVKQMAGQCKFLMVGGRNLTENESWALAILAVSIGLNPFMGEIFYIPGSGPFVGIKGQRRNAANQLGDDDHVFPPLFTPVDPEAYGGKEGDLCYQCELRDSKSIKEYAKVYQMMRELLGDKDEALLREVVGHSPTTIGIGIVTSAEIEAYNQLDEKRRKTAMTPTAKAKKRAEADAYRQRFPIGAAVSLADVNGDMPEIISEGEIVDVNPVEIEEPDGQAVFDYEAEIPTSERNYRKMVYETPFFSEKDSDLVEDTLKECGNNPQKAWRTLFEQHVPPQKE